MDGGMSECFHEAKHDGMISFLLFLHVCAYCISCGHKQNYKELRVIGGRSMALHGVYGRWNESSYAEKRRRTGGTGKPDI